MTFKKILFTVVVFIIVHTIVVAIGTAALSLYEQEMGLPGRIRNQDPRLIIPQIIIPVIAAYWYLRRKQRSESN